MLIWLWVNKYSLQREHHIDDPIIIINDEHSEIRLYQLTNNVDNDRPSHLQLTKPS